MLKCRRMERTLTAKDALSWYFKHRHVFAKRACSSVNLASVSYGINRKIHAEYALATLSDPFRVNTFLLQQADVLALDTATRSILENDAAEISALIARMRAFIENPWA